MSIRTLSRSFGEKLYARNYRCLKFRSICVFYSYLVLSPSLDAPQLPQQLQYRFSSASRMNAGRTNASTALKRLMTEVRRFPLSRSLCAELYPSCCSTSNSRRPRTKIPCSPPVRRFPLELHLLRRRQSGSSLGSRRSTRCDSQSQNRRNGTIVGLRGMWGELTGRSRGCHERTTVIFSMLCIDFKLVRAEFANLISSCGLLIARFRARRTHHRVKLLPLELLNLRTVRYAFRRRCL